MIKAVIFDLDGTLLNTLKSIAICGNTALAHFGYSEIDVPVYANFVGNGSDVLIARLMEYSNIPNYKKDDFRNYYFDIYSNNSSNNVVKYDGVEELIIKLRKNGIKTAVLSNKPHNIAIDCCNVFFNGLFDVVIGQRDNMPKKPESALVTEVANMLDVKVRECAYCGDSSVDVMTARNSNIQLFGAGWGFYNKEPFKEYGTALSHPLNMLDYIG